MHFRYYIIRFDESRQGCFGREASSVLFVKILYNKGEEVELFKRGIGCRGIGSTPVGQKWNQWKHHFLGKSHCKECLMLESCWFAAEKTPQWPYHFCCHCELDELSYYDVVTKSSAYCPHGKFDPNNSYKHGKGKMFESWGYSISDSVWLQKEIQKQGLEKYISGEYVLGKLNHDGQRISIRIEIPRKDRFDVVSFISGWMVYPNGYIQLTTPYGGK